MELAKNNAFDREKQIKKGNGELSDLSWPQSSHFETTASGRPLPDHFAAN